MFLLRFSLRLPLLVSRAVSKTVPIYSLCLKFKFQFLETNGRVGVRLLHLVTTVIAVRALMAELRLNVAGSAFVNVLFSW
jgi:hypothetical protein